MTARPDKQPEWATDGAADIVEPSLPKKILGWITDERPPAQFFNWWMNKVFEWNDYWKDIDTLNWTQEHGFPNSSFIAGSGPQAAGIATGKGNFADETATTQLDEVVVFYGNDSLVSEDGIGGRFRKVVTPHSLQRIRDVVYVPSLDLWVACGDGGVILTRPGSTGIGTVWTSQTTPSIIDLKGIAFGDVTGTDTLVAVGFEAASTRATIFTSVDGVTWVARTGATLDTDAYGVIHDASLGLFVLCGASDEDATRVLLETSPDGVAWTVVSSYSSSGAIDATQTTGHLRAIATDGQGNLVTGGSPDAGDDNTFIWHSTNGTSWTRVETPPAKTDPVTAIGMSVRQLVFGSGRFLARMSDVTGNVGMMQSLDRATWKRVSYPSTVTQNTLGTPTDVTITGGSDGLLLGSDQGWLLGDNESLFRGLLTG